MAKVHGPLVPHGSCTAMQVKPCIPTAGSRLLAELEPIPYNLISQREMAAFLHSYAWSS